MKIYFGNTLIDEDYYLSITNSHDLFNENFELGSTASNTFNIAIGKEAVSSQPTQITIKDASNNNLAILNVDSISEDDYSYTYTCSDSMTKLNFSYDASQIFVSGSTTLLAIVQDICTKASITLGTSNFRGYNKSISFYDNTKNARDYISYVAELNGGYAYIENNVLYFKKINTSSVKTISIDDCVDFKIGEHHTITRVVYQLGTTKYEYGNTTGDTLYLRGENVYINSQSEVQEIYNEINGFEYYAFETTNCPIDYSVKAGQIITFSDGTNNYKTIASINLTYNGGWYGGYQLNIASSEIQETQNVGINTHLQSIDIKVDRNANEISQTVSRVGDLEQSIEVLNASLDTNVVVIGVDDTSIPFTTKDYTINYSVKYLGSALASGYTITTSDTHTGITTDISTLGTIKFSVSSSTAIPSQDNKYTFTITYNNGTKTYSITRTVMVSTLSSDVEQNVVISTTAPTDTNVLWYDSSLNQLKRYADGSWTVVNDYSSDIKDVSDDLSDLSQDMQNKIFNGYDTYILTTDTAFVADKNYYEYYNNAYVALTYDSTNQTYTTSEGTVYNVGSTIPSNTIYDKVHHDGLQSQINNVRTDYKSEIVQEASKLTAQITTTKTDLTNTTTGKLYYTNSTGTEYSGARTGNPNTLGLYEQSIDTKGNVTYILTEDTTFVNGLQGQIDDIIDYVSFDANEVVKNPITGATSTGAVIIGKSSMQTKLKLSADVLFFDLNDNQVAYIATTQAGDTKLFIKDASVTNSIEISKSMTIGNFGWTVDSSGSITFGKVK